MRVLVVSPYPPSDDPLATVALQNVRALRAAGDDVDVLSPEPSAARFHARIASPRGALALERAARGRDRVIVHFRPDCFPAPGNAAARRTTAAALRAALRGVPSVELVLHGDAGPDGDVANAPMAAILVGAGARVVEHEAPRRSRPERAADRWPAADGPGGIEAIQAAVRARAADVRRRLGRAPAGGAPGSDASPEHLDPVRLTVPGSSTPGVATLRRVLHRLTAWETEPIVARLNRLSALASRDDERAGDAGVDPGDDVGDGPGAGPADRPSEN